MSRPWMPLYVADYQADTAHLSTAEHGAYLLLIMFYWTKGGLPKDEEAIRRITRMTNRQWSQSRDVLKSLFGDEWRHKRIEDELAKAIEKSSINSANAKRRHSERKADAQRSDTHARASSQPQSQSQKEEEQETRVNALVVDDDWPPDYRDRFWERYPNKVGKPKALAKLDACRKRRVPFNAIMAGLDRYIRTKPPDRQWLNPETFINQERWNDQPAPVSQGNPDERSGSVFANSRPQQSGSSAVLAGVAAAAERRARERVAAGQQRPPDAKANAAAIDDPDFFGAR